MTVAAALKTHTGEGETPSREPPGRRRYSQKTLTLTFVPASF
jgi:hypothetical protein